MIAHITALLTDELADCVSQALLILVIPGFLRYALRSDRPALPVTDTNGQYIAGGGAAGKCFITLSADPYKCICPTV